jgi:hypothetical protein
VPRRQKKGPLAKPRPQSATGRGIRILFMTKRLFILLAVAFLLAGTWVYYSSDWFAPKKIQIFHSVRPAPPGRDGNRAATDVIIFGLNRQFKLSEVQVVPLAEWQSNKNARARWHLISDGPSAPTKSFAYGQPILGMQPAVPGARPEPLEPSVAYRLLIRAGSLKAEHDFQIAANPVAR